MYCIKCGENNLEAAKFCRKCGESFDAEQETVVAARRGGDADRAAALRVAGVSARIGGDADTDASEAEIFVISPTLMFVKGGYAIAAVAALLVVAAFSSFTSISIFLAILIGLLLFLIPAYYHFRLKTLRYTLTDSQLEIDEGFISRNTRSIPIRRIQDVSVSSGVVQRLLGFGDLSIDNASDDGGKVVLRNINTPKFYADILLRQMRRLDR
ncbi:MAG: PH domain-containing protein [Pyrinomonadaceae bacterium]